MDSDTGKRATSVVQADKRQLIAVVYADMVGYSRLIGLDDGGTFARLQELRRDLIDPALVRQGGTLVNTAGDSLLMTFPSIIAAMRFAVDVQRGVPDYNQDFATDRQIQFRIAVNVGDVIADGTNLHGEGINIAARLQTLCPPGGVCVSRIVRDHVGNRLGLGFKELGSIDLKNIARPVEAFLLDLAPVADGVSVPIPQRRRHDRMGVLGAVVGCAVAVGALAVAGFQLRPHQTNAPPAAVAAASESTLPPLSIAVLPFSNLSGDPEQAYLADGIAEDLTTDLSHLDGAFVIARESAFTYRGKTVDIRDIGRQLGVRYVLEGSVRKMNASVRINAQLIAAETGAHVWAERFDKPVADLGEGQDDIVARIASALGVRLVNLETARQARAQSGTPAAFDLVLRARSVLNEPVSQDRNYIALGLLLQALRTDPKSVPAMAGVAALFAGWFNSFETTKRAADLLARAEKLAPAATDVLVAKFLLLQREQRRGEALELYRRLLEVDASATGSVIQMQLCRCWTGFAEAIPLLRKTILLNPRSSALDSIRVELARTLLLVNKADEARFVLEEVLAAGRDQSEPDDVGQVARWRSSARIYLAIAYERAGRDEDARATLARALQSPLTRDFTVRGFLRTIPSYADETEIEADRQLAADLRRAGLRDHLDEDADSGVPSTGDLQDYPGLIGTTPMSVPGAKTIRTPDLIAFLAQQTPVILTTSNMIPTIPQTIYLNIASTGSVQDVWQAHLGRLMNELARGDLNRPIVVFGRDLYQWAPRNLVLRLVALGYTQVYWYRGGWEAWEASGQPRGPMLARRNL